MTPHAWTQLIPLLIALPIMAVVLRRNMKGRRLRVEWMWVRPVILLALGAVVLSQSAAPSLLMGAAMAAALVAGAGLGWMRGKMMRITVDPETHMATMQASPIAVAFIVGLVAVRYGARALLAETAPTLHVNLAGATNVLLVLAIGLVVAQQLEMWLRCRRLITDSKVAKAARGVDPAV